MKIQLLNHLETVQNYDAYVIPFTSDVTIGDFFDENFRNMLRPYLDAKFFEGKKEQLYSFTSFFRNSSKHAHIVLVGLGEKGKHCSEIAVNALGKAVKELQRLKAERPLLILQNAASELNNVDCFFKSLKAMQLAHYSFEKYQTKEDKLHQLTELAIYTEFADADKCLKRAELLSQNILLARDLVNEPANIVKPADLATLATEALADLPIEVKVKNKAEIEKLGMYAYLAVAQGSKAEPRLIVMNYKGNPSSDKKLALVGKGLTFDSGGYSIKPTDSMMTMKTDMAGSAAVIGAIRAIAQAKLKINVVAIVAAAENMISGEAYLPGDIIPTMNGKFIEIVNTDAEGRLTLIDAITYAIRQESATKIVDIATLTGAALVALGKNYAGVVTNDEDFYQIFEKASRVSAEKTWRLPLDEAMREANKSKIADLKNSGGRFAGSSVAGAFIQEFVEDIPWIHVDIAGTADVDEDKPNCRRGATGYGVELLFTLASML